MGVCGKRRSDRIALRRLGQIAWYKDNSGGETHGMGQKQPNTWNLYDMLGNVFQWVADWYETLSAAGSPILGDHSAAKIERGAAVAGATIRRLFGRRSMTGSIRPAVTKILDSGVWGITSRSQ